MKRMNGKKKRNGFTYAIKEMGKEVPEPDILKKFVGPPLSNSPLRGVDIRRERS